MPHPVVLHVHAVDAIARGVQPGAQAALQARLSDVCRAWVDYQRPGLPLTRMIAQEMAQQPVDALLLANHALVVGNESAPQTGQRLADLMARLRLPLRGAPPIRQAWRSTPQTPAGGCAQASAATRWRPTRSIMSARHAARGVLSTPSMSSSSVSKSTAHPLIWLEATPFIVVPGLGLLLRDDLPDAARKMIDCLAEVLQRLPQSVEPLCLPQAEAQSLAHWKAKRFRQRQPRQACCADP